MKFRSLFSNLAPSVLLASVLALAVSIQFTSNTAHAEPITDFDAGHIIHDDNFYNKDAMSVAQIQAFLDSLIPNCDTWGTTPSSYYPGTRAEYAASVGWPAPPYVCINKYHENLTTGETSFEKGGGAFEGGTSAAQIIYTAAQKYGISPHVLLVLLKKESAGPLTSDTWPFKSQYKYAMGYACPDSGPNYSASCDSNKAGFYKQVDLAAWQLKYYKDHPNDYRYKIGWNDIQYSTNPSCGTRHVYVQNIATLSLYIYTPYTPNDAALAAYPGEAPCGAYGNRNFYQFFKEWFGDPRLPSGAVNIKKRYESLGGSQSSLGAATSSVICGIKDNGCYQNYQNGSIVWSSASGAWESTGPIRTRWAQLKFETSALGYPTSGVYCGIKDNGCYQNYQNGSIVWSAASGAWESMGGIRKRWERLGYENSDLGYPTGPEVWNGNGWWQNYQNGAIIGTNATGFWESTGPIRTRWAQLKFETSALGYPTSGVYCGIKDNGCYQNYQNGAILWSSGTGAWENYGPIRNRYQALTFETGVLGYPIGAVSCGIKGNGCYQNYQNGAILWSSGTGAWENYGSIRTKYRQLGYETSTLGYPNGPIKLTESNYSQTYQHGAINCDGSASCQVTSY